MIRQFPKIVGIVNVTPDSFSDGGMYFDHKQAIDHALRLIDEGADMLDIGGESTRPGAHPVDPQEELRRVIPVIEGVRRFNTSIPISIDTTKASVARAALDVGATMINDISAARFDPLMLSLVVERSVPIVLMHMQGTPQTMQLNPTYTDVVEEVFAFLLERITVARAAGVTHIIADVGIGFGKRLEHNLLLLRNLHRFTALGVPLYLGISRKRFIGELTGIAEPSERDCATAMVHALLLTAPVEYIRVHNVSLLAQLRTLWQALHEVEMTSFLSR
ncbi:MAG: dihydropteroate synthase [Bacteroidota bacterium]|nr:dihydropteroate synthase [Candidatus Kapabacteria bacterium]MCS7302416.1 dihydropteroate synthase [Candidatus Kapabacteria bacterium]MCX7937110.1 dihydropteroate synthase [Chlorobiota bacterium]MDW8074603.1 dihydropteroate synthase [Bacteroidota bacterium]MDW8270921.1 dihydropteroate synthase [Bacteroidota bacterium]